MSLADSQKEVYFQAKLIQKYGQQYGVTLPDNIFKKINAGEVFTPEEQKKFDEKLYKILPSFDKIVNQFKEDLRKTEPEDYSDLDVEIVIAMADANLQAFKNKNESFSKVIPNNKIFSTTDSNGKIQPSILSDTKSETEDNTTVITGFAALSRYSENLSPQQQISQFGLDYENTPYLVNGYRQPFVFAIETPMTDIKDSAKLPIDPRLMFRMVKLSQESSDPVIRDRAKSFLTENANNMVLIYKGDKIAGEQYLKQQLNPYLDQLQKTNPDAEYIQKINQLTQDKTRTQLAPYTGTTAPLYGEQLEKEPSYADVVQEMYMRPVPKVSKGAIISISFPRPGVDAQRDDIPAGSDKQEIARWNGERWEALVNPEDLKNKFERSISTYPPEIANQWREDFNKFTQDFPLKVPESLKKKIKDPQQNQTIKKGLRKQNQQSDRTKNQKRRTNTAKTKKR